MLSSDIAAVLVWWAVLFLLGLGFLPLTFYIFQKFFDRGYIFSKLLGLAITSYGIYVIGILHILPFTIIPSYIIFLLLSVGCYFLLPRWKIVYLFKKSWKIILFEEIFFFLALLFWAYIHSFNPDIHGLEKYMDYGFVNSILRAQYFPPKDMWFTPLYINYYYFGHLMTAVLTRLSGLQSNISFNLMLSTLFAFCLIETFSIGSNIYTFLKNDERISNKKRILSGLLTSTLVTFAGNLHIMYAFFKAYPNDNPVPIWQLPYQPLLFPNAYWYPNATRFIYHTIHEFPIYSWVVADLHGHVLDIPFVLLTVAVIFAVFDTYATEKKEIADSTRQEENSKVAHFLNKYISQFIEVFQFNPFVLLLIGFLLAVMYMTNAWDGAIYFLLAFFVFAYLHWQKVAEYKKIELEDTELEVIKSPTHSKFRRAKFFEKWTSLWLRDFALTIGFIIVGFTIFTFPYNAFFKPFASGIGILCAPDYLVHIGKLGPFLFEKDHCQHSLYWELLMLYGGFYFFVFSYFIFIYRTKKVSHTDVFITILIALSTLLIIIPEFIYLKDIYPAHYRANTMFKLVFQAFMLLGISSAYIFGRIISTAQTEQKFFRYLFFTPFATIIIILVMLYPYQAINSYYDSLKTYRGLDGTKYLATLYPSDYAAIQWLNKTVKGQPVILEAQGDSYTDFARVSANTGLPTVLGWTVHEWLWRGTYDIPAPRISEVQTLYETATVTVAKNLLKKYNVKYVFIGTQEYQKYTKMNEDKFRSLGKVVFQSGTTKIYEIN